MPLRDISFAVGSGEILGLAGVGGNGQTELVEALIGVRKASAGNILFEGEDAPATPEQRREWGLRFIPADRMQMGLFGALPLNVNLVLPRLLGKKPEKRWFVGKGWMNRLTAQAIEEFEVAGAGTDIPARRSPAATPRAPAGARIRREFLDPHRPFAHARARCARRAGGAGAAARRH